MKRKLAAVCGGVAAAAVAGAGAGPAASAAALAPSAAEQCSTSLRVLRPHYPDPVRPLRGAASSLSGAGSSWAAPYLGLWATAYAKQGVKVSYQPIGSGGGVAQISAQTVDFGASDVPMTPTEQQGAKGGEILHIPMALGAAVVAYHVKGVRSGLRFDGETLGRIFAGQIRSWSDAAIRRLNPGVHLPDEPIAVAHRSDGSGTTNVFTHFLTQTSKSWVARLGGPTSSQGKVVAWPTGIGGKGNDGVAAIVNQTEGAIGYVELQYAVAQHLTYGVVRNAQGVFVRPCPATITAAANKTFFPRNLKTFLTNRPGELAYPITGTTYALVYANQRDAAKAKALVNFFSWALTTGQNFPASIDYAPLGRTLQQRALAQLGLIRVDGRPLVKIPAPAT